MSTGAAAFPIISIVTFCKMGKKTGAPRIFNACGQKLEAFN